MPNLSTARSVLTSAKRPAILLGKGAAYAQVDDKIKTLIEKYNIPYLPMSMAKGLMPDAGPLSALSCRSTVMEKADVVMVIGARLNWMLSFGRGKWNPDMKFIQLDVDPEEMDVNVPIAAPVVGDMGLALDAILAKMDGAKMSADPAWVSSLQAEAKEKNAKFAARLDATKGLMPMHHWTALGVIKPIIEANPDIILINEGANTLDDTRDAIDMTIPRHRVDCATGLSWVWAWDQPSVPPWPQANLLWPSKVTRLSASQAWTSLPPAASDSRSQLSSSTTAVSTTASGANGQNHRSGADNPRYPRPLRQARRSLRRTDLLRPDSR